MELTEVFEWEGRRIAWARAGSGPPVVFCHGTPFSSRVWWPYLTEVPGAGHLVPYDAPVELSTALRAWLDPTA
jgi:pimeloyl-ACP methyl ester carboxylesterase